MARADLIARAPSMSVASIKLCSGTPNRFPSSLEVGTFAVRK